MTSDKVLSDAELKQAVNNVASKSLADGISDLFNGQEVKHFDIIIPLDVRGDDLLCYSATSKFDENGNVVSVDSDLEEQEAYKLKGSKGNTVYVSELKDLTDPNNVFKVGMDAMDLAIKANSIARSLNGEGVVNKYEPSPNKTLEEDYKVNGITYDDLKEIKKDLESYAAEMYYSGTNDPKMIKLINETGAEISEVMQKLDLAIIAPKAIEDFKEVIESSREFSHNDVELMEKRLERGSLIFKDHVENPTVTPIKP